MSTLSTQLDIHALFLQPAVVGVQVTVLYGAPVMTAFTNLRTLTPHVEAPFSLCVQQNYTSRVGSST